MSSVELSIAEIESLVQQALSDNGCDEDNLAALTRTIVSAERDGSSSHGLFRLPGYIASLRSGKVSGCAAPKVSQLTSALIHVDGNNGFAPLALERGLPVLADAAQSLGIAAMSITATHHFAALWHETEALSEYELAAFACVNYAAVVAPFGGSTPIFGTNPISFAWPRPGRPPAVFDMATAAMAQGELQIAAREGTTVPPGTGLDADGKPSTNPQDILDGVQLPFGGHKGSALAFMVEMLAAGMTGEPFSVSASNDVGDGGPPRGGELLIAMAPEKIAGPQWAEHSETFFEQFAAVDGARLPGSRRHENRTSNSPIAVNSALVDEIRALCVQGSKNP